MDTQLQQTIDNLEEDFYQSLASGPSQVETFAKSWITFLQSLPALTSKASSSTMDRIEELGNVVATMASGLLEYEEKKHRMGNELSRDISNIIENELTHPSSLPRYLEPSWKWLCANLHNPYPSQALREQIATEAKVPRRLVDSWFTDARKRIGWNDIRKNHFPNKQAIIDAATRFFVACDDLESTMEFKFARMESTAKSLYAGKLDVALGHSTPESRSTSPLSPTSIQSSRSGTLASLSPSPKSRKRSLSTSSDELKPRKRPRFESAVHHENAQRLPTPPPSQGSWSSPVSGDPTQHSSRSPSPSPSVPLISKQKQRLSFCDQERRPKRPTKALSEPRRHAVSDPLPSSSTGPADSWYATLFDDDAFSLDAAGSCQMELPLDFPLDIQFANITSNDSVSFPTLPTLDTVSSLDDGLLSHAVVPSVDAHTEWRHTSSLDSLSSAVSSAALVEQHGNFRLSQTAFMASPLSQNAAQPNASLAEQLWSPHGSNDLLTAPIPHNFIYAQQPLDYLNFPPLDFLPPAPAPYPSDQPSNKTDAIRQEVHDLRQKLLVLEAQLAASS